MDGAPPLPLAAPRVLLVHAAADEAAAQVLSDRLRDQGAGGWFERWSVRPEDSIDWRVAHLAKPRDLLLVLLSAAATDAHWLKDELNDAQFCKWIEDRGITLKNPLIFPL